MLFNISFKVVSLNLLLLLQLFLKGVMMGLERRLREQEYLLHIHEDLRLYPCNYIKNLGFPCLPVPHRWDGLWDLLSTTKDPGSWRDSISKEKNQRVIKQSI